MRALPLVLLLAAGCDSGVNIFTLQDDRDLGAQLHDEILANPDEYPLVDEADYPDAYDHLYRIQDQVLTSDDFLHRDDFEWQAYLIDDPDTLNAFAAPGGYTYYYTGLIEFLEHEDEFAGVLAHELAHIDQRHTTQQLTELYGVQTLVEVVLGEDPGLLAEIATGLVALSFSRQDEREADEYSVRFLCDTDYAADGAAGFFQKLMDQPEPPPFLSTHPSSDTRVEDIQALADELGCSVELNPDAEYDAFLASLP